MSNENENIITQEPDNNTTIYQEVQFNDTLSYCELWRLNYF